MTIYSQNYCLTQISKNFGHKLPKLADLMKGSVGNHFDRTILYICDVSPGTAGPPVGAQRGGQGAGRAGAALPGGAVQVGHQEGPGVNISRGGS